MIMKNIEALTFVVCVVLQVAYGEHHMRCIPKEREALLQFKAAIVDRYGMLSSWTTPDCCRWEGIRCSNLTGHVLRLHLPGQFNADISRDYMSGEIHTSLMELQQLEYLNLSSNYFRFKGIPEFLGSLINLKYLDLSSSQFGGKIPSELGSLFHLKYLNLAWNYYLEGSIPRELGNLSRLQYLDLRGHSYLVGYIPSQLGNLSNLHKLYLGGYDGALNIVTTDHWLSNLISLTHLSFQSISNFDRSPSWFQMAAKLPKLRELSLVGCGLSDHSVLSFNPSNFNFSASLTVLDLSQNSFTQSMIFQWVSNTTSSLVELYLSSNLLEGSTSNGFGLFMNSLERLDLSYNVFKGQDLKSFMNICTLCYLDMSGNNMTEDFLSIIHHLSSGCARYSLQELNFKFNHITRSLVDLSIFSSLKRLDLFENQLSGKTSEEIKLPSQLEQLSIGSNSLEGGVPKSFGNTCTLELLDLSRNKLSEDPTIIFDHLSGCSRFSLREIYLSQNKLNGTLPDFSMFSKLEMLDLSGNHLKDGILKSPHHNGTVLRSLRLSNNLLNGNLPTIIYHLSQYSRYSLQLLDLSMNQISGTLPNILSMFSSLKRLYLESNKLNGTISEDLLFSAELEVLNLRSNSLKGDISSSLGNCTKLVMLDMAENRLSGSIPHWIGSKLLKLQILSLGNNHFNGSLPLQICYLRSIRILDLSQNNLFGQIPKCIKNFSSMTQKASLRDHKVHQYSVNTTYVQGNTSYNLNALLTWKGSKQMFTNNGLSLLKSIDLSNNQFSGEIPKEIGDLFDLISLNLSRNNLMGKIPSDIGKLKSLEFIDLSRNELIGSIPSGLAQIDRLTMLDLPHNYLSGKIPIDTQLQSFDASKYEGNVDLCGPPLEKLCPDGVLNQKPHEDNNLVFNHEFYVSMAIGFVINFGGVFGSILVIRSLRHVYFKFLSNIADTLYIMTTVKIFKWWRRT
ncbi:receptor-like protein EIX2 isoform X5 [Vigna unguiculata]|uniref:receptor-like protein EIX2 isoform X5 n=1 Tax=Vigna unguiculata TaxID=3917 RepID=UPI0010171FA2|nr:receptor-like protein EIX2 isoform X5 [Vigna unguiculata]